MNFVISSSELLKGVSAISKAIPVKTSNPILQNFLFELKDGRLDLTASDTELTLKTTLEVEDCKEEGRIAVPATHIMELLKEMPDQPISFKTTSDSSFECKWNSGDSNLPYFPADDYPAIKGTEGEVTAIDFPAASLVEGIACTVYATADDEIRPTMNGIFFDIDTESTTLVASDAHKLICYTTSDVKAPSEEKASFILHKKPASVLRQIIDKDVETVHIEFDSKSLVFTFEQTLVICRQIVGRYPKYRDIIPQNNSNILKIDRAMFLGTLRRVAVCSNKASSQIKLDLKENSLEVSAQDLGFSLAAYEKIACSYDGEQLSIGFKSNFLIEILSNMTCGEVVMKFADSKRAALVVPAEDEAESEKLCGLIMPIMFS